MSWVHRCMIVPVDHVDLARSLCATLAGDGGSGMFTTPLSPTGDYPPTHWISSGMIADNFAALLPLTTYMPDAEPIHTPGQPDTVAAIATANGYPTTAEQVQALFAAADVTEQDPFAAMERLGLMTLAQLGNLM